MKPVSHLGAWSSKAGPCSQGEDVDQNFMLCSVPAPMSPFFKLSGYFIVAIGKHWASVLQIYSLFYLGNLLKIKYK